MYCLKHTDQELIEVEGLLGGINTYTCPKCEKDEEYEYLYPEEEIEPVRKRKVKQESE